MNLQALKSDPEFMALPYGEKMKAMSLIDSDFAALPDEEKHRGLSIVFPPDVRDSIAYRREHPPAAAHGDPNREGDISGWDIAGAAGKGLAHAVGVPTSHDELKRYAVDALANIATAGMYGVAKQGKGYIDDLSEGYAPIVGRPLADVAAPARAVANNRPPTKDENLRAVESGTALSAAAAGARWGGPAVSRLTESLAPAMERAGIRQYADTMAPQESANRPLAESMASRLADEGVTMKNPPKDLARMAGERGTSLVGPDGRSVGDGATWNAVSERLVPEAQAPQEISKGALNRGIAKTLVTGAATAVGGPVAGKVVGGALGASEALGLARKAMNNPLWKTTSGGIKVRMARAIQTSDFATIGDIAGRVIGAKNLADAYGHDEAVVGAVNDAMEQAGGKPSVARQILASKEIAYENPDGTTITVPFHIARAFVNQLGWNVQDNAQRMAPRDEKGGQAPAGRASGVQGQVLERASGRRDAEWPKSGTANENDALLSKNTAASLLPERFVNARQIRYGQPRKGTIHDLIPEAPPDVEGVYGAQFTFGPKSGRMGNGYDNTAMVNRKYSDAYDSWAHETGHGVYNTDLTPAEKTQWQKIVDGTIADLRAKVAASGIKRTDPNADKRVMQIAEKYPVAIVNFGLNPQFKDTKYDESFSELLAQYVANPSAFKATYPSIYGWYKQLIGKEYIQHKR